jgi:hypothetical protein
VFILFAKRIPLEMEDLEIGRCDEPPPNLNNTPSGVDCVGYSALPLALIRHVP